ncbi:MAG: glycosyltransferase family 2 protein [Candidatus Krumholzibacteria bacterium]|nr:glycosyltransferase family 2 protein [Candidatus Krumholzibacteria bacterium]
MYQNKRICVILPAYNEEVTIGATLDAMPDYIDRVIVVDDGSKDGTARIAEEKGATVLRHGKNKGVGAAFNTGLRAALNVGADITVNMDADGQFNPADIVKLIAPMIEGKAEFVTASRFMDPSRYPVMSRVKFWGNEFMALVISKMAGQKFYDVSCGFRAYSRNALMRLNLFGDFTYTQESFLNFAFKNVSILEVPVEVRGRREHGRSRVASNLFRYAYQTLKIILKTVRDYKPFRMFAILSLFLFVIGAASAVFLTIHYFRTGALTPHKWAGFVAGFSFLLAFLCLGFGFILDMFARMRLNQERILFLLKRLDK